MPTNCNGCKEPIMTAEYMKCNVCRESYDLKCLNIEPSAFKKYSREQIVQWICPSCISSRPKRNNTNTPIQSPVGVISKTLTGFDNVNMSRGSRKQEKSDKAPPVLSEISELVSEIRQLRNEVHELKEHLSSVYSTLTQKLVDNEKKIAAQETEILNLRESLTHLKLASNAQEQYSLKNELELAGIPESESENLCHIAMVVAKKIGVELTDSDIDDVSRAGPKLSWSAKISQNDKLPRPIVLKLLRRTKREEITKAAKARRNLTTEDVIPGSPKKIFINERLTKANRILFREARQRAQQYKFRFCWVRNGSIYVREDEFDKKQAILIRSTADLDQKVGPARE